MPRIHQTLYFKILFPLIFLMIIFGFVIGYSVFYYSKKILIKKIESLALDRSQKIQKEIILKFSQWKNILYILSHNEILGRMNWNESVEYLNKIILYNKNLQSLFIADRKGHVDLTLGRSGNIGERDYFHRALAGETVISEPVKGKFTGNPLITITAPMFYRGNTVGIVGLGIELDTLSEIVNAESFGKTGYSLVLDRNGVLICHPVKNDDSSHDDFMSTADSESLKGLTEEMKQQKTGVFYYTFRKSPMLAGFMPVGINNWSIASTIHLSEIFTDVNDLRNKIIIVTFAGFSCMALIMVLVLNKRVLRPVRNLKDSVNIIKDGDFSFRIRDIISDEIGDVGASINEMAEKIEHSLVQLIDKEEILRKNLSEREILLNEIHHRVNNNLNSIIGLLNLQMEKIRDASTISHYQISINRIYSMALIHELLTGSGDLTKINTREYIMRLMDYLLGIYGNSGKIRIHVDTGEVTMTLNQAVPFGLIVNELVTNSCRHAFAPAGEGEIRIDLSKKDGGLLFIYSDNGKGVSREWNPEKDKQLGFELILSLVQQIKGELKYDTSRGLHIEVLING